MTVLGPQPILRDPVPGIREFPGWQRRFDHPQMRDQQTGRPG